MPWSSVEAASSSDVISLSMLLVNPQRGCLLSPMVQNQLGRQEDGEPGPPLCLGMCPDCS